MAGFQGICQCGGKNESLTLTQDREVLQPVLNRAVRPCKCSKKASVLAIDLKHQFPKRMRILSTALWLLQQKCNQVLEWDTDRTA